MVKSHGTDDEAKASLLGQPDPHDALPDARSESSVGNGPSYLDCQGLLMREIMPDLSREIANIQVAMQQGFDDDAGHMAEMLNDYQHVSEHWDLIVPRFSWQKWTHRARGFGTSGSDNTKPISPVRRI